MDEGRLPEESVGETRVDANPRSVPSTRNDGAEADYIFPCVLFENGPLGVSLKRSRLGNIFVQDIAPLSQAVGKVI